MFTVLLPPGFNPIAVNKYININIKNWEGLSSVSISLEKVKNFHLDNYFIFFCQTIYLCLRPLLRPHFKRAFCISKGHTVAHLVEALRYKPITFRPHYGPVV